MFRPMLKKQGVGYTYVRAKTSISDPRTTPPPPMHASQSFSNMMFHRPRTQLELPVLGFPFMNDCREEPSSFPRMPRVGAMEGQGASRGHPECLPSHLENSLEWRCLNLVLGKQFTWESSLPSLCTGKWVSSWNHHPRANRRGPRKLVPTIPGQACHHMAGCSPHGPGWRVSLPT